MLNQGSRSLSWLLALSLIAVACGDDDDDIGGTGGTSGKGGKGGSASTGGSKSTTGGTTSGGTSAKGGSTNGGSTNGGTSGGVATTGGTGDAGATTGGVTATGGSATGGANSGGTSGSTGEGGMSEGGSAMGGQSGGGSTEGGSAGASTGGTAGVGAGGSGGDSVEGGAGGSGGEATVLPDTIDNPGFDVWDDAVPLPNWTRSGSSTAASFKEWKPGVGNVESFVLSNWAAAAFEVTTSQLVSPLPNGSYRLSIWHKGVAFITQRIFARGYDANNPSAELAFDVPASDPAWAEVVLTPIPVTSGHVEIGVYSNGAAGNWSHFDDVTLTKLP